MTGPDRVVRYVACCALSILATLGGAQADERRGWPAYQGGQDSIHYSSLTQIDRGNVKDLEVAWVLDTGDAVPNLEMNGTELSRTSFRTPV